VKNPRHSKVLATGAIALSAKRPVKTSNGACICAIMTHQGFAQIIEFHAFLSFDAALRGLAKTLFVMRHSSKTGPHPQRLASRPA